MVFFEPNCGKHKGTIALLTSIGDVTWVHHFISI